VPVDYQPDFDDYSLVPVDYDPFPEDGVAQQAPIQLAQAQPQQQPPAGAGQPDAAAPAAGDGIGPNAGAPNPDQGTAKAAPFGGYANPTPTDPRTLTGGLNFLHENGRFDSYVYEKNSTGTAPTGPQVTTANGSHTITATDGAKRTNFGGVYGHTLTVSKSGSNNLKTITAADPTGLLVATPVEGDPNVLSVREYKGY
jgi:hypothetical protein